MLKQLKCNVFFGGPVSTVSRLFPDSFGVWRTYSGFLAPDISNINEVSRLVNIWVNEIGGAGEGEEDEENMQLMQEAWDDVNGGNCLWE